MAHKLEVVIKVDVFDSPEELPEAEKNVLTAAQQATQNAYAPYSGFLVGTALLLEDGSVHTGNNQENAAYPSGLCAERTALFGFRTNNPTTKIRMLAVTARPAHSTVYQAAWPCGSCRQVITEYETRQGSPIKIIMQADNGQVYCCNSASDLLPLQFSGQNLG